VQTRSGRLVGCSLTVGGECKITICFEVTWAVLFIVRICRDFLVAEGDLEVEVGEWKPFNLNVPEDVSKLKFTFTRSCTYAHPRTTMLMFGPKNAPAKQTQFLYLWGRGTSKLTSFDDLLKPQRCRPKRGLVLTMTQFDGIPMADTFKVLQYWGFEDVGTANQPATLKTIGVHIHFIKSTLLKGQVVSGVRDELAVLSKKYIIWARNRTEEYIANNEPPEPETTASAAATAGSTGAEVSVSDSPGGEAAPPRASKKLSRRLSNSSDEMAKAIGEMGLPYAASSGSSTMMTQVAGGGGGLLSGLYGYIILGSLLLLVLILFIMQRSTNRALNNHRPSMNDRFARWEKLLQVQLSQAAGIGNTKGTGHYEL
jgi:hypothetical protein